MAAAAGADAASPAFVLTCFVAVGFIVATSLALANAAGLSAHLRNGKEYIYQGAAADRVRSGLRMYPSWIWFVFLLFACAILVSFFTKLDPSIMVGFAIACIAIVVSCMSRICWNALAVAANNPVVGRGPP